MSNINEVETMSMARLHNKICYVKKPRELKLGNKITLSDLDRLELGTEVYVKDLLDPDNSGWHRLMCDTIAPIKILRDNMGRYYMGSSINTCDYELYLRP